MPRLPRRLSAAARGVRGRLRQQGLLRAGRCASSSPKRACRSTSLRAASSPRRASRPFRRPASTSTATTSRRPRSKLALDYGIGFFVVDSLQEIATLDAAARRRGACQQVLVRLTPGVQPSTHRFVQTGQADTKFGFGLQRRSGRRSGAPHPGRRGPRAGRRARPYRLADLRPLVVSPRGRGAVRRRRRLARASTASTAACSTSAAGWASATPSSDQPSSIAEFADAVVGAARDSGRAPRPAAADACWSSRGARSPARRRSRPTASARSRRSRGCAPTSRSTAA